jgi:hypothetical protein
MPSAMLSGTFSWLSEVVRHERRLTVSWHQRVNRAEQDSGSH